MAIAYNPLTTTSNLSLYLDAANKKSYVFGENLLTYSTTLSTNWAINQSAIRTQNAGIAPDNTNTAISFATSLGAAGVYSFTNLTGGATYTFSVYVKYVSGDPFMYFGCDTGNLAAVNVNTQTGATSIGLGSPSNIVSTNVGNGWYRVSFSVVPASSSSYSFVIYSPNSTARTWLTWGAQLERSSTVNTYVPTVASAASQSTSWLDLSGNGNTGTLTNAPAFNNYANGALSFNGSSNYISGTMPLLSGNTTIEAVVRFNSLGGLYNIFTQGQNVVTFSCGMVINGTNLRFRNSNSDWALSSPQTLATNQWYHLVLTSGPGGTTGYVNGVSNGSTVQTLTSNAVTAYEISRRPSSTTEYVNGDISFVKVYNRFFSQSDVLNNFAAIRGRFGI